MRLISHLLAAGRLKLAGDTARVPPAWRMPHAPPIWTKDRAFCRSSADPCDGKGRRQWTILRRSLGRLETEKSFAKRWLPSRLLRVKSRNSRVVFPVIGGIAE